MVGRDQRIGVAEEVAQKALVMLREQGLERQTTVETMRDRLVGEVRQQYKAARQFKDQHGPLWAIDVSRTFNDMMLYAVAREVNGKLEVVHIADEAELEPMFAERRIPRGEGLTPEQVAAGADPSAPLQHQEVSRLREELQAAQARVSELGAAYEDIKKTYESVLPNAQTPTLVRVKVKHVEDGKEGEPVWEHHEVLFGTVSSLIQEFLAKGLKPEHIEIWTSRKTPKVRVELE